MQTSLEPMLDKPLDAATILASTRPSKLRLVQLLCALVQSTWGPANPRFLGVEQAKFLTG
jgi:hypothetical protein